MQPPPLQVRRWRLNGVWLLIVVLIAILVVLVVFQANSVLPNKVTVGKPDVFEAKPMQKYSGNFEGIIYADTNCMPVDNETRLNCIAVISRNGEIEKYYYSHPVEIPCLNRDEQVRVEGTVSDLRIIRLSAPSMKHS